MSSQKIKMEYEFSAKDAGVTRSLAQLGQYLDSTGSKATVVSKRLTEAGEKTERFSSRINKTAGQLNYFTANMKNLDNSLFKNNQTIAKNIEKCQSMKTANKSIADSIKSLNTQYEQINKTKEVDARTSKQMESQAKSLQSQIDRQKKSYEEMGHVIDNLKHKKKEINTELIKAEMLYGKDSEKVQTLKKEYDNLTNGINRLNQMRRNEKQYIDANQQALNKFVNNAIPKIKEYAKATELSAQKQKELSQKQKELASSEKALSRELKATANELQNKQNRAKSVANAISDYKYKTDSLVASFKAEQQAGNITVKTITAYENKLRSCDKVSTGFRRNIDGLKQSQEAIRKTIDQKTQALTKLEQEMKENGMEATALKNDIKSLEESFNGLDKEIKEAETAFESFTQDISDLRQEVSQAKSQMNITDKLKAIGDGAKSAGKGIDSFGKSIKSIGQTVTNFGSQIVNLGDKLKVLTTVASGVFTGATASGVSYEKAMAELTATIDKTDMSAGEFESTMARVENRIRTLALDSPFNPTELANGMRYLSLAGYDCESMLNSLQYTMTAAQITGQDLASTTDLVTDAMSAFHLEAKDMPRFLDVMAKLQSISNTNMAQATEAFIWAGGTLADLNITLEESGALFGVLANQGMKSALAGRSMLSIIGNITDESSTAGEALKKLQGLTGIKVTPFDEKGNYIGIDKQLKNLKEALSQVGEQERIQLSYDIAGKNQKKTLDKLLNGMDSFDTIKEKLQNSEGTLFEMKDIVDESAYSKVMKMLSSLQEAFLQVWDVIKPYVMFFVEKITELAGKFSKLTDSQQGHLVKMLLLVGLLPIAIKLFGLLIMGIGNGIKIFGGFISTVGGIISFLGGAFNLLVTVVPIAIGFLWNFLTVIWDIGVYLFTTLIPALAQTSVCILGMNLPLLLVIAVIGILIATIAWMVSAFKRGFDENANILENFCNMFKTIGEDFQHLCLGMVESLTVALAKMFGASEKTVEKIRRLFDSDKDNRAQAEGYADYKDQKKQLKEQEKAQKKAQRQEDFKQTMNEFGSGLKDGAGELLGNLGEGFSDIANGFGDNLQGIIGDVDLSVFEDLGIDFSSEGLNGLIKDFKQFQKEDKTVEVKTEIEQFAFDQLEKLEEIDNTEYEAKVAISVAEKELSDIEAKILQLSAEKRTLEMTPGADPEKLQQVTNELNKLFVDRQIKLDIIEENKGKLEETKKQLEELNLTDAEIEIKAKEVGMTVEEYKSKLKKEQFLIKHGVELDVENAQGQINSLTHDLMNLNNKENQIRIKLQDPNTTIAEAQKLRQELVEITGEKLNIETSIELLKQGKIMEDADALKSKLEEKLEGINIELAPYEGIKLEDIVDVNAREHVKGLREEQASLNKEITDTQTKYDNASKAIQNLGADNISKAVEYMDSLSQSMDSVSQKADKVTTAPCAIADDITEKSKSAVEGLGEINLSIDTLNEKGINIDTTTAQTNIDGVNAKLDTTKLNIDNASLSMDNLNGKTSGFTNAFNGVDTSSLVNSISMVATKMDEARNKLISFNNIANSTSVSAFTNMGNALLNLLNQSREKLSHIAGYCNNTGKSSMTTMGNALSNSVVKAREKLSHIAGYAVNTGKNSLSAMGNALLSKLNTSYGMVKSIASMANSIKISVPSGGLSSSGGKARSAYSMPQAINTSFVLPSPNRIGGAFNETRNSTYNTANLNISMSGINTNSRISANNFYRQLKKKCQRDGLFD